MADFDSFDALTNDPLDRAMEVQVQGLTLPWLVDGLAIKRAQREGHELGEILAELGKLQGVDEEESVEDLVNNFSGVYDAAARLLWLGFLRFEQVDYDSVLGLVGPDTIGDLPLGEMMTRLFPEMEEGQEGNVQGADGET